MEFMIMFMIVAVTAGVVSKDEKPKRDTDAEFILRHQERKKCYQDYAYVLDKKARYRRCFVATEVK